MKFYCVPIYVGMRATRPTEVFMIKEGYKKTEIGVIPVEWEVVELGDILEYEQPTKYLVKTTDYDDSYSVPVLTAGKTFILGYTNETNGVFNNLPVIIFDDFTTASKYVDFPFKAKSSAMKILKVKDKKYPTKLFYEYLNDVEFFASTHKRYWISEYQNLKIPLPPLKEQKEIANILSTADKKIEAIDLQIQKAQMLKKGLLQKLLSEGIGHSEFKDSELGRIPENWEVVELDTVAKLNKQKYTPIQSENLHYIGLEHINQEQGTINGVGCSTDTLSQKNCFNKGEILFGKLRPYLRKFYLADIDGVCSTEILVIKAKDNILNSILFQIITTESFIEHSISKVFGTKMPRTSWAILKEFKLALPPLKEQKQIAQILSTADKKLELLRAKKEKYETLKKGLLQKLLSGEIRV